MSREIELKLSCRREDFDALLAAAPPGEDRVRELRSVYFDTPGRALERLGASLRVRHSAEGRMQTLKLGAGLEREEHEVAVFADAPDPAFPPLAALLGADEDVRALFEVRLVRRQRRLRHAGAEIELALDEGEVSAQGRSAPICELELELKSGDVAALFDLADLLARAAPLERSEVSKAARGRALLPSPRLEPPQSLRDSSP